MADTPKNDALPESEANQNTGEMQNLLVKLRRKEGNWVEWGHACQTLQKGGFNPQKIFEETGFEPIQQNQIIVAAQVYNSITSVGVSENTRSHFEQRGSDSLYELRILTQTERAAAAEFLVERQLDSEAAKEVAKAMKDFSRLGKIPEGFSPHPGDCLAYQYWKWARQKSDLQERSRLIAQGLRFANSNSARQQIEKLLLDFTVTPKKPAPTLPVYRLESESEMPRIMPVAGKMPLTVTDFKAVPLVAEEGPFRMIKFSGVGAWVPVPGWQVILKAEDPVVIESTSDRLPKDISAKPEEILIVVDRSDREWDTNSYFLAASEENLEIIWFEETPTSPILGKVILILRPKKIFDEEYTKDTWQIDE